MKNYSSYHTPVVPVTFPMTVTQKGQITIPAPIREALNIKHGDTVAVSVQEGAVRLTPVISTLAAGYQAIPALQSPLSLQEIKRLALDDHAEAIMHNG